MEAEADRHRGVSGRLELQRERHAGGVQRDREVEPVREREHGEKLLRLPVQRGGQRLLARSRQAPFEPRPRNAVDREAFVVEMEEGRCRHERDLAPADRIPQPGEPVRPRVEQRDPDHRSSLGGRVDVLDEPQQLLAAMAQRDPEHSLPREERRGEPLGNERFGERNHGLQRVRRAETLHELHGRRRGPGGDEADARELQPVARVVRTRRSSPRRVDAQPSPRSTNAGWWRARAQLLRGAGPVRPARAVRASTI